MMYQERSKRGWGQGWVVPEEGGSVTQGRKVFPGVRRCEMSKEEQEQGLKTPTGLARRRRIQEYFK